MTVVAAVDIGTNSTRLLVSDGSADLERRLVTTRLGRGAHGRGTLAPDVVAATLRTLAEFRSLAEHHGAARIGAVATAAVRDARDGDEFVRAAAGVLGVRPEVLDGDREGRLAFAGATAGLARSGGPFLVVDIGGGSTELVLGAGGADCDGVASAGVGAVRITEAFLRSDPPRADELSNAVSHVYDHVDDAVRALPGASSAGQLIGVAGTITTVAAIEIGLAAHDPARTHGFVLTRDAAEDVFRTVATEALADRVHNPGLGRDRADIIVGGCCVLVGVMRRLGYDRLVVSERDLLDGLAAELAGRVG